MNNEQAKKHSFFEYAVTMTFGVILAEILLGKDRVPDSFKLDPTEYSWVFVGKLVVVILLVFLISYILHPASSFLGWNNQQDLLFPLISTIAIFFVTASLILKNFFPTRKIKQHFFGAVILTIYGFLNFVPSNGFENLVSVFFPVATVFTMLILGALLKKEKEGTSEKVSRNGWKETAVMFTSALITGYLASLYNPGLSLAVFIITLLIIKLVFETMKEIRK